MSVSSPHLQRGRSILQTEIDGLSRLADGLDESFDRAVEAILGNGGQLVISGMGKSGHIARKAAATFASTGTRAIFIHPAEASHGDLGMISSNDLILMISNSGETRELSDMIEYSRRLGITMIGMTGVPGSTLARTADIALLLPAAAEACSLGLAPTTSTTMQLALTDALAVTAYERRAFSPEQFRNYHPGGTLGQQLRSVRDLMHTGEDVPVVDLHASMSSAILTMTEKTFGCVAVVDANGAMAGIITDGDLRRHMSNDLLSMQAQEIMTRDPKTIGPDSTAAEALSRMNEYKVQCLFVLTGESGQPQGIIRIHDCLKAGLN